jgi:8-oxo-dGTP diphosphatase
LNTKYRSVAAIIKDEKGRILVEDHVKIGGYVIPGGKIDDGESEYSALCRELNEELGIFIDHMIFDRVMYFPNIAYPYGSGNYADFEQYFYTVQTFHGEIENREPTKHLSLKWMLPEELLINPHTSEVLSKYLAVC